MAIRGLTMSEAPQAQRPTFQSPEFLARAKRMDDAMHLRKPDRVPVAPIVIHYYGTRTKGISNRNAMYQLDKTAAAWKEVAIRHNWDCAPPWGSMLTARAWESLEIRQVKWPGGGLAHDQPFQWVEAEYMTQDEYDEILANPNGFAVGKLWPRLSAVLEPLGGMAQSPPPSLAFLSNAYTLPPFLGEIFSSPLSRKILRKALEIADDHERNKAVAMDYAIGMMSAGFPVPIGALAFPAFDWISDTLRGLKGTSLDMYKVPDKLLTLIEAFTPLTIGGAVAMAQQTGGKGVFIAMHRGAGGFMSDKQFAKFYWPCFKALIMGLIEAGLTPTPLFEGDYTPRLEYLAELPPGKVVGHFDHVDRKKAKKLLGDVMCFWGNVPASLMCTGNPQQVKDDVKELIDTFGDNGGLIIDSTMGIPDEAREENVQALTEAVHEYGVY